MRFPWHAWLLLLAPARVAGGLARVRAAGWAPVPNLWQIELGVLRMWHRILFRSGTIGTCTEDPPRRGLRARLLGVRLVRFFPLLWGRHIAPWDLSGFLSTRERVLRHLLGAHHDRGQAVYDLQMLSLQPDALLELRARLQAVVGGSDPQAGWLRDLVVYERYHEHLLSEVERALAGDFGVRPEQVDDPDITFRAYLRWCARQPTTPAATWAAWRAGRFHVERGLSAA